MVEFVVTPPFVIPVAIAAAVLAVATFKAPEKAPDLYRMTIDLPKATYDALARNATVDIPVRAVASRIVVDGIIPQGRWRTSFNNDGSYRFPAERFDHSCPKSA